MRAPPSLDPSKIDRVIVHHSASPVASTTPETVRDWHITGNGWPDVGYHFVIDGQGQVHLGRPLWRVGSHDQGENSTSWGICLLGDWRGGPPTGRQWTAAIVLCADLLDQLDLGTDRLFGHRENEPASTPTECPGFDPALLRDVVQGERTRRRIAAPGLYPYTTRT